MTPAELDEIEQLLKKATPGPWHPDGGYIYADVKNGRPGGETIIKCDYARASYEVPSKDNASLIVLLRNHAPALLAAARRVARIEAEARRLLFALSRGNQTAAESFVEIADLRAALAKETL